MGKAVFFNIPAHGHVNPTLPLVTELVNIGEEVIYYGTEEFRDKISKTGASFRLYPNQDDVTHPGSNNLRVAAMLVDGCFKLIPDVVKELENEEIDYVVHDSMCVWGWYIAKILNLTSISSTSTFVMSKNVIKMMSSTVDTIKMILGGGFSIFKVISGLRRLKVKYGIRKSFEDIFSNKAGLNIVYTSKEFQPFGSQLDNSYRFIGPSIAERVPDQNFPIHELEDKKVIYISLGTLFNERIDFYKTCIGAFKDSDFHVVISVGKSVDIDQFKPLPDNIMIFKTVPQLDVLKKTELFLTHGGMNSVSESLFNGVPMIVYPQMAEQGLVAYQVESKGAGEILKEEELTVENLFDLAKKIIMDDSYRKQVEKLKDSFISAGGYKKGAEEIINYYKTL